MDITTTRPPEVTAVMRDREQSVPKNFFYAKGRKVYFLCMGYSESLQVEVKPSPETG